jgi:hypothetical protein
MIQFEAAFIKGLFRRASTLALVCAALAWWWSGAWEAVSVVGGVALMVGDITAIAWLLHKMLGSGEWGLWSAGALSLLFLIKLLVLFGLAYYFLAVVGLAPAGFAAGCIIGLAGLNWHVIAHPTSPAVQKNDVSRSRAGREEEE